MKNNQINLGVCYVVATPIGNRADMTQRAMDILKQVDVVYCEDTRHSRPLLQYYQIDKPLKSLHEHNESDRVGEIEAKLKTGESVALISDAGTPLISDPGYVVVKALRDHDFEVRAIPGPSALIAALSIAGVATDRFCFEGFLPAKPKTRQDALRQLSQNTMTTVVYESSHRIVACVKDMVQVLPGRHMVLCKELTKQFEKVVSGKPSEVLSWLEADAKHSNGEFVLILDKAIADRSTVNDVIQTTMPELIQFFSPYCRKGDLAKVLSQLTGQKRQDIYQQCMDLT